MPWLVLLAILTVAVAAVPLAAFAIVGQGAPSTASTVTLTHYYLEWSTPPTNLCPGWTTNEPPVPFSIAPGARFTVSWRFECWNGSATYTMSSIQSVTPGFALVSSNLPVILSSTNATFISITLSAPLYPYYGDLSIWVLGHAN